jgi:iron-sulfur cluster repair protein YtfE (RIC family)
MNFRGERPMATARAYPPVLETPLGAAALSDPLEYLKYEHFRQLVLCELLGRIADDPYSADAAHRIPWVRRYLTDELALHVTDEEQDLMPLLDLRCNGGDALTEISDTLEHDHVSEERLRADVVGELTMLAAGKTLDRPLDFIVKALAFEEHLRRHLMWENLTLMPLARRRLTTGDLATLGRNMARRHERHDPGH